MKNKMQKIRKTKVNQAIEELWLNKTELKRKTMRKLDKSQNIHTQCKIVHYYKKNERQYPTSLSMHRILSEMKLHVNQKNWSKVKNLFLSLLHYSTDIEPLIWRYSFILTLYSNIDNLVNTLQFFKLCIGSQDSDKDLILKNLLLLKHHK